MDFATPVGKAGSPSPNVVTTQGVAGGTPVPVSLTDGADVTLGAKADAAATDSTSAWSVVSLLKSLRTLLAGTLTVKQLTNSGTNRSITATTNTQVLMGANSARLRVIIKNDTAIDVWVNLGGAAVATAGGGNYRVPANGGYLEIAGYTGPIQIIAASSTAAISALEL